MSTRSARRGELLAEITVDDEVKPSSKAAIELLRSTGARCVMLTGDNEAQARKIAEKVGLDEVYYDVLPEDKLDIVESLKKQGRTAMVGDGINDAPALKAADVGIAIGSGTDVAIDAADVVLVKSDLIDVPRAVAVSRSTLRNVKQNLFWAFLYNTLGIPLAAGVLYALGVTLDPMIAAGAMAASSLFVVCNALRLTVMRFDDARVARKLKRARDKAAEQRSVASARTACPTGACEITDNDNSEVKDMEVKFKVDGMSCMHCVARVKAAIEGVDGVKTAEVDLQKAEAVVTGAFEPAAVAAAADGAGYPCVELK